jgi:16S rRNA (cytosine1407-C5)-methyltransferase
LIELSQNITDYILHHFGEEYFKNYRDFFNSKYQSYIRVSPFINLKVLIESLGMYGIELHQVDHLEKSFKVLKGEEVVGKTLEFILGHYYIQSLSSMIPALVLDPQENEKVLDLCAAPGSKTTQLAELMRNRGSLIANEISMERLKSLVFNVDKMNLINVGILHRRGEVLSRIYEEYFDKILVDAPCSALGITQKKGEVSNWWNKNKLVMFSDLQLKLLIAAAKMCKVGGTIVYSTCTLSFEENELVLNKLLHKYPLELMDIELPVHSMEAFINYENEKLNPTIFRARRIIPWKINSEGFFVAKLLKNDRIEKSSDKIKFTNASMLVSAQSSKIKNQLDELSKYFGVEKEVFDNYKYLIRSKDIYFCNREWDSPNLDDFLRIGSKLGSIEKRGYIQLHTLAAKVLGKDISKNVIELSDKHDLKIYLKGGTIRNEVISTGQKIITHNNQVIGTAVVSKEGLKSQFPRPFRTQEIVLANG